MTFVEAEMFRWDILLLGLAKIVADASFTGSSKPKINPVANIVIRKDSGSGKLRMVKLSGISSGITNNNSLEIKVGGSKAPRALMTALCSLVLSGQRTYRPRNFETTLG